MALAAAVHWHADTCGALRASCADMGGMDHRMGGSDVDRANPPLVLKDEPAELVSSLLGLLYFIFLVVLWQCFTMENVGFFFC